MSASVRWRRDLVLLCFVAFFVYAYLCYTLTSRVQRATLPALDKQGLAPLQSILSDTRLQPVVFNLVNSPPLDDLNALALTASLQQLVHSVNDEVGNRSSYPIILQTRVSNEPKSFNHQSSSSSFELPEITITITFDSDHCINASSHRELPVFTYAGAENGFEYCMLNATRLMSSSSIEWQQLQFNTRQLIDLILTLRNPSHVISDSMNSLSDHAERSDELLDPSSLSYRLSFTLMTEQPEPCSYTWSSFHDLQELHFAPLIKALAPVLKITLDSQTLQYADLLAPVIHAGYNVNQALIHFIKPDQLANFIGSTSFNLESPFASSAVQLWAFIPSSASRPLFVGVDALSAVDDAFIIPRWGSVIIVNNVQQQESASWMPGQQRGLHSDTCAEIMERALAQFRLMLGLDRHEFAQAIADRTNQSLAAWETDGLIQRYIVLHAHNTLRTLMSLYRLIEETPHMPVVDEIAHMTQLAMLQTQRAREECQHGRWRNCSAHLRSASLWSSKAFYHPSMMPTLYFPIEHLYAVYAPLFAPILLPVVSAVSTRFKELIRKSA